MKRILILQLLAFTVFFASCDVESLAQKKSVLPQAMPQDFEVKYLESGGFAPKHHSVRLDGKTLYVETKAFDAPKKDERSAEISDDDRATLYKAFVDNEFDLITYEKTDVFTSDAIVRSISMRVNGKIITVESDPNKPLSELNKNRFGNVLLAIQNLENKYQSELNELELEYSVIKIDSDSLSFIAKNSQPAEMNQNEIATALFFAEKLVSDDSNNPKYSHKLLPLKDYKFQFVPFVDDKGTKRVWVNAFCRDFDFDWRKNLVLVKDGGRCYFNFKINLDPKRSTTYDFQVNGEA